MILGSVRDWLGSGYLNISAIYPLGMDTVWPLDKTTFRARPDSNSTLVYSTTGLNSFALPLVAMITRAEGGSPNGDDHPIEMANPKYIVASNNGGFVLLVWCFIRNFGVDGLLLSALRRG